MISPSFAWGLLVLIAIGVPIVFALGAAPMAAFLLAGRENFLPVVAQRLYTGINQFPLLAIPLFILAGEIMNVGGITARLVRFANALVGHLRGGLAHVNIVVAGFSAAAIGDVDNDGFDDIAIGTPGADENGVNSGAAYIIYGGPVRGGGRIDGTAGDDDLSASVPNQSIWGGDGNDRIEIDEANATVQGGRGDDVIQLGFDATRSIDGGAGQDTLGLLSPGAFDLSAIANGQLANIERLDLLNGETQTVTITAADIFSISGSFNADADPSNALTVTNSLTVRADDNDTIVLEGAGISGESWALATEGPANAGGLDFYEYRQGGSTDVLATIGVDENATVSIA